MSELVKQLLDLINAGATATEISEILGLSHKQINNIISNIRNKGYDFERKYYSTGDIVYVPIRKFTIPEYTKKEITLLTSPQETEITVFAMADLHIGSEYERLDAINKSFDYCLVNNIHTIAIGGDFIDGMSGPYGKKHASNEGQIKYALKNYPFDKNIITFLVLGNHDNNPLIKEGQDLSLVLKSYRHDIVPLGYGVGQLNIKNDKLVIIHPLQLNQKIERFSGSRAVIIRGHSHKAKIEIINRSNSVVIYVPSISDRVFSDNEIMPGAMIVTLRFQKGYIRDITVKQLMIDKTVHVVNEFNYTLGYSKKMQESQKIVNEEFPPKRKILENPNLK